MILLLVATFIGIAFFEVPNLIRKKYWYELVIFSIFFILAFSFSMLQLLGIKIPSPIKFIEVFVKIK
jgi:hypothetical protein